MSLEQQFRRAVRRLTRQSSPPSYTYSIGDTHDPAAMHGLALTPRQWTVIRHVLIAAGEQDSDVRWRSGPVVRGLGQNLAHWDDESDADESLLIAPEYVLLIGETLAAYQEGRVTVSDAVTLDERAIDLGAPVTAERVDHTLTRLGEQTAVSHTGETEQTETEQVSQSASSTTPRYPQPDA